MLKLNNLQLRTCDYHGQKTSILKVKLIISWVPGGEELKHLPGLLPTFPVENLALRIVARGGSLKVIIDPTKKIPKQKNAATQRHRDFDDFAGKLGKC